MGGGGGGWGWGGRTGQLDQGAKAKGEARRRPRPGGKVKRRINRKGRRRPKGVATRKAATRTKRSGGPRGQERT